VIRRRDRSAQRETSHYSARPPPTACAPAPTTAPSPATAPSPPYIDDVARHRGLHGNRIRRHRGRLELRGHTHRERAGDASRNRMSDLTHVTLLRLPSCTARFHCCSALARCGTIKFDRPDADVSPGGSKLP